MNWESRIVGADELRRYMPKRSAADFRSLVRALFAQQRTTWTMLREAVAELDEVQYKELYVRGAEVLAQFNPKRIVSTGANVEAAMIKGRPCFLCADNLPPEEMGVAFGDDLAVLCNPFPVLPRHLVISSRRHIPQEISGAGEHSFATMLDLARALGDEYFVLYNGPGCGASAPDHLHFQACERRLLPIIRDIEKWERQVSPDGSGIESFTLKNYRLNTLIARSIHREALAEWFEKSLELLAEVTGASTEPMLNVLATIDGERWTVISFPRSKHRPSCYYAEGEAKLTVSPAGIDLSGVLVVPQLDHFARISSEDVEKIYAEVTLEEERFNSWIQVLSGFGTHSSHNRTL
jgi:hypothetical protein